MRGDENPFPSHLYSLVPQYKKNFWFTLIIYSDSLVVSRVMSELYSTPHEAMNVVFFLRRFSHNIMSSEIAQINFSTT
jgi:hypothetical protein